MTMSMNHDEIKILLKEEFEYYPIRIRKSKKTDKIMAKRKRKKEKHTHKSKDRVTRTPLKSGGEFTQVLRKLREFLYKLQCFENTIISLSSDNRLPL